MKDFLVSCFAFPVKQMFLLQANKKWTITLKAQGSCFRLHPCVCNLTQFSVFLRSRFSVLVARDRPSENEQAFCLWIRNLCDCWEWMREAGGLRDTADMFGALKTLLVYYSNYTPTIGYYAIHRLVCPGLITAASAATTINNNALFSFLSFFLSFFCCCVSQCGADGHINCSVRISAPRLSSLEPVRPAHAVHKLLCALRCSDTQLTATMCVTGCDKQESVHSQLLWKQVNYPWGSRRKKCVDTKAERAPTKWVWKLNFFLPAELRVSETPQDWVSVGWI